MKGKRTGIEFEKHEVLAIKTDECLIHHLKKPDTMCDSIKYINCGGVLAVTGDYGNWIFCREFHPSEKGFVRGGYWEEKLKIASSQEPEEFDEEGTIAEIKRLLSEEEELTEDETEYLNGCMDKAQQGRFDYEYYAHRENCGRFEDHEYVPHRMKTKFWLQAVFDGFDEICRRLKEASTVTTTDPTLNP